MDVNHFLRLVREELDRIKSNATTEEIGRLDFATFCHENSSRCIYGQMTGYCFNERALEIMGKSLASIKTKFPKGDFKLDLYHPDESFRNNHPQFTYLEQFLFWSSIFMHQDIISYLKGEIDDIVLELDSDKFP